MRRHRCSDNDFTRLCKLPFSKLIIFQLNMVRGALQNELDSFFSIIRDDAENLSSQVGKSAYCQARKKFNATAFIELNNIICDEYYQRETIKKWHGHRVLAVDGSIIELPFHKITARHFNKATPHANHLGARISELYDPLNNLSIDMQITRCDVNERTLACRHLEHTKEDDLILYDRGYPAIWLMSKHLEKKVNFCMRSPWSRFVATKAFISSDETDVIATMPMTWSMKQKCRAHNVSDEEIQVRLLKVNVPGSEEVEVLITSLLDKETYPYEDFEGLYHQRWYSEENYKCLKSKLEIENFSGYSKQVIEQEIHAKSVTRNLASILGSGAQKLLNKRVLARKLKRRYQINFSHLLRKLKNNVVRLLLNPNVEGLIERLIIAFSQEAEAIRTGRKFDRNMKKTISRFTMQYKRC